MSKPSPISVTLEAEPGEKQQDAVPRADGRFRIAVLADLAGESSIRPPLANRRSIEIDRDNFDQVFRQLAPAVTAGGATITFRELDDFHPDQLWSRLAVFDELRNLRRRLDQPATFESAARELLGGQNAPKPTQRVPTGNLLEAMIEEVEGPAPPGTPRISTPPKDELQEQIRRIVLPHIVPGDDPRKMELSSRVDDAAGELMRQVLHDPAFQALESTWRALHLLVHRLETGAHLSVHIIDLPRTELSADLASDHGIEHGALHRLLVDQPETSGERWSLVVGDYSFGPGEEDVLLLSRVAEVARGAGAPFVAGADPQLAGCPDFEHNPEPADWRRNESEEWSRLRRSGAARFVGLVLPRFITRLPYGEDADSTDALTFEEMSSPPRHSDYLWANGAYAAALLLAESYGGEDRHSRGRMVQNIDGLPLHLYRADGEAVNKPCAEALMTERAANRLIEAGLMPLASIKDSGEVRLVRFQSIAQPSASLAGLE